MENYAAPFILSLIVIFCITEAILSFRCGERGLLGEPKFHYNIFDSAHLPMWIIIALDTALFFGYYLMTEA